MKFQPSRPQSSWEKCDEKFQYLKIGEKEKWRNKMTKQQQPDSGTHKHLPIVHVCTKFQSSRPHSSWEKCDENFNVWKLGRKKNEEIKGWISRNSLIPYTRCINPLSTCVPSFNLLGFTVSEKNVTKTFNVWKQERKTNEEIKGQIRRSSLIPVYTIHLPTVHVCTKFQSSRPHSSWEKWRKCSSERLRNDRMTEWQNHRMMEGQGKSSIAPYVSL